MAYELPWGSTHPGLLIYLVDLSGSMIWDDKISRVSNTIWNVVDCLTAPCQDNGIYKNRYHLKVIGYNDNTKILFEGGIDDINNWLDEHPDEQFIDVNGEGKPHGLTYMALAFEKASEKHNTSYPLDWIENKTPKSWKSDFGIDSYNWD